MSWQEICARCKHFTTIGYPEHKARGEGRCTGYDGTSYELKNPFVSWDHRTCVHFFWASPMAPRTAWIEKQQEKLNRSDMQENGMAANRRLAELLGWTDIFDVGGALLGTPPPGMPSGRNQAKVPDWTGDWRDCGPLMVEHVRTLGSKGPWVSVGAGASFELSWCRDESESDDAAMRRAIVSAVTMKLLEAR